MQEIIKKIIKQMINLCGKKNIKKNVIIIFFLTIFVSNISFGQEKFLPFLDDFSSYVGKVNPQLWIGENCQVNVGFQVFPPTVGVVTLDAINRYGELYPQANTFSFTADTLSSVSIRLDSVREPIAKKLSAKDSIYLSFFIQPGGGIGNMWQRIGSTPSAKDSIVLQFYSSSDSVWTSVWNMKGTYTDSIFSKDSAYFHYVMIPITDNKYFNKDFRFRFYNYASLDSNPSYDYVSNCDQWNLDYIYLNYNRSKNDTVFRDIAFVNPAPSMLKLYQSMPAKQYRESEMKDSINITIVNLYSDALNSTYKYDIIDKNNNIVNSYNGGFENIYPYIKTHSFQTSLNHSRPLVSYKYSFDKNQWTYFDIVHVVREGVGQDSRHENDTIRFRQKFENYFAYDDGTAENGFGVEPIKNSNLAVGYFLNEMDTLSAVDIYFNHTYQNANIKPFYICVWNATSDSLPNEKLYMTEKLTPIVDSLNKFIRYTLTEPVILPEGEFFISVQIKNKDYLNIGFDQNTDASNYTFANISNYWQKSFNRGSVMIRPYFGYKAVGLNDNVERKDIKIFPNPAKSYINIYGENNPDVELYDIMGRRIKKEKGNKVNVEEIKEGVYILRIKDRNNNYYNQKVVIQK
ncbi:MAG: T9SS type A sorting domain-containing protein [Bacteroidales bacterium]|nr:T9SS type A sorting domain-containing protein [Bacteroidales bacterium]